MKKSGWQNSIFYSDLAVERHRFDLSCPGIEYKKTKNSHCTWEKIKVTTENGAKSIGRPMGRYDTLTLPGLDNLSDDDIYAAAEEISSDLCQIIEGCRVNPEKILVVGLGNPKLTPDSIGPESAAKINATWHLSSAPNDPFSKECFSKIAVFSPGVPSQSGIESFDLIQGLCNRLLPDVVIAIDSLAAGAKERLGKTIQISDTGIQPGGGVGKSGIILDKSTLGIPVIAIGIPTIINAEVFLSRGQYNCSNDFSYEDEKMFVCPGEINEIVLGGAKIISEAINQAFGIF